MMPYHGYDNEYFKTSKVPVVDLRSDTVTKPTPEMKQSMLDAEVGDDVYLEDPTMNHLEKVSAEIFGKEKALFVPTGTMGNLIATHCDKRGCEVIMGDQSHTFLYEQGGAAQIGGVHSLVLPNLEDGTFSLDLLQRSIRTDDIHFPATALIIAENTHNMCGGRVLPMEWLNQLADLASKHNIRLHMDGARIFNAAVYLKIPVSKITEKFDSVQFCFSKGLGAPIGSMLVGSEAFIKKARRLRKVLGGGMRQVGVIGAPCLVALNRMVDRLAEDHRRTEILAKGRAPKPAASIAELKCDFIRVDLKSVQTNILMVQFNPKILTAADFCHRLATLTKDEEKELKNRCVIVRVFPKSVDIVRMVLYYEINDDDIEKVSTKLKFMVREMRIKKK